MDRSLHGGGRGDGRKAAPRLVARRLARRRLAALAATLPLMPCAIGLAVAQPAVPGAPEAVRQAVLAIMSYTRWPEQRAPLRLCVVGQPDFAGRLLAGDMRVADTPVQAATASVREDRLGGDCDAVYSGALDPGERTVLRNKLAGFPVLTVGERDAGCAYTMFCLEVGSQVTFGVNLDLIARGGIAVNPRVLLLGRKTRAAP